MPKHPIIPASMATLYQDWKMAPATQINGFLFLTGFNGTGLDGVTSPDPAAQINTAFDQVFEVLAEAGLDARHVVEVTSYHVGLKAHLEVFKAIWAERMCEPWPAWTAIEVAGFVSDDVIVELRVVAHHDAAG